MLAHCRLRLPPVFQLGVGRRAEGCWVQALPGQLLREEIVRRRWGGKKVSVLFEDSTEATQALTNAPSPRQVKASSPLKEREEEGSDKWYWRSFCEKGEVVAFEEVEPLGRQAEKDHPVIRCRRYCI